MGKCTGPVSGSELPLGETRRAPVDRTPGQERVEKGCVGTPMRARTTGTPRPITCELPVNLSPGNAGQAGGVG